VRATSAPAFSLPTSSTRVAVHVAALGHFLVDVADDQLRGDAVQLRDGGARALHARHQPFGGQLAQRAVAPSCG
jgi:hypothetical protein